MFEASCREDGAQIIAAGHRYWADKAVSTCKSTMWARLDSIFASTRPLRYKKLLSPFSQFGLIEGSTSSQNPVSLMQVKGDY
jgi:hypothetical protein